MKPRTKVSDIKLSHIFSLVRKPTYRPYLLNQFFDILKSFPVFVIIEFWLLHIMPTLPI